MRGDYRERLLGLAVRFLTVAVVFGLAFAAGVLLAATLGGRVLLSGPH